ncbi:hypothetical protein AB1Y20_017123 [Prymnesium parvum]|uniref:EF-hand domain-containing protein n=1 Tax=Prymnesium parvum TaxID=97485 RepID=A0AB34IBL5_PRYPA
MFEPATAAHATGWASRPLPLAPPLPSSASSLPSPQHGSGLIYFAPPRTAPRASAARRTAPFVTELKPRAHRSSSASSFPASSFPASSSPSSPAANRTLATRRPSSSSVSSAASTAPEERAEVARRVKKMLRAPSHASPRGEALMARVLEHQDALVAANPLLEQSTSGKRVVDLAALREGLRAAGEARGGVPTLTRIYAALPPRLTGQPQPDEPPPLHAEGSRESAGGSAADAPSLHAAASSPDLRGGRVQHPVNAGTSACSTSSHEPVPLSPVQQASRGVAGDSVDASAAPPHASEEAAAEDEEGAVAVGDEEAKETGGGDEEAREPLAKWGEKAPHVAALESLDLPALLQLKALFTDEGGVTSRRIRLPQLGGVLQRLWPRLPREQVDEVLKKIDVDGQGQTTWEELLSFMVLHNQLVSQIRDNGFIASLNTFHQPTGDDSGDRNKPHVAPMMCLVRLPAAYFSCSTDGSICFWDTSTLEPLPKLYHALDKPSAAKKMWPLCVTVLPAHSMVLVGCADRLLQLYDCTSHDLIRHVGAFPLEREASAMCAWCAAGHDPKRMESEWMLACGDRSGGVVVYRANPLLKRARGREAASAPLSALVLAEHTHAHTDWVSCVSFAKHHAQGALISGSLDATIRIQPLLQPEAARTLRGHAKGVNCLAVIESAVLMVSAGFERLLLVWNLAAAEPLARLGGHLSPVVQLQIDERNTEVISLDSDGTIRVWDMRVMRCIQVLNSHASAMPEASTVHLSGSDVARVADVEAGQQEEQSTDVRPASAICLDPFSRNLISGSRGLLCWPSSQSVARQARSADRARYHEGAITSVAVSAACEMAASADALSAICVWRLASGELAYKLSKAHGAPAVTALSMSHSGRRLISGAADGSVRIWNLRSGEIIKQLVGSHAREVTSLLHISLPHRDESAKLVIAGCWSGAVQLWYDDDTFHKSMILSAIAWKVPSSWASTAEHEDDVTAVAFRPPATVVSASYDGGMVVWELGRQPKTNKMILHPRQRLAAPSAAERMLFLTSLSRSPDGAPLLSACADGQLRVWRIVPGASRCLHEAPLADASVAAMCTDAANSLLLVAHVSGRVRVWSLRRIGAFLEHCRARAAGGGAAGGGEEECMSALRHWRAADDPLSGMDFLEARQLVATGCTRGIVKLWTLRGSIVGLFGQQSPWDLADRSTFLRQDSLTPSQLEEREQNTTRRVRMMRAAAELVGRARVVQLESCEQALAGKPRKVSVGWASKSPSLPASRASPGRRASVSSRAKAKELAAARAAAASPAHDATASLMPMYDSSRSVEGLRGYLEREATHHRRHPPAELHVEGRELDSELDLQSILHAGRSVVIPGAPTHHPSLSTSRLHDDEITQRLSEAKRRIRELGSDLRAAHGQSDSKVTIIPTRKSKRAAEARPKLRSRVSHGSSSSHIPRA